METKALALCLPPHTPTHTPPQVNPCLNTSLPFASMPFCDHTLDINARAKDAVARLSLSEKISALGTNTPALKSLGLPSYNWYFRDASMAQPHTLSTRDPRP